MWTKPCHKGKKYTSEGRSKTPMLKLPNIANRDMWVKKKWEMAEGMGKDKRLSGSMPLSSYFWKAVKKVRCWVNMNNVFVVVQFYPWLN